MLIWTALIIPVVACIIGLLFFSRQVVIWELITSLVASLFFIGCFKYYSGKNQTDDIEFWGGYATKAEYYEDWDEEVPCTHSCDCHCEKDKDGHESCDTCYRHSYDVDYHPPEWHIYDSNGFDIDISENQFKSLAQRWKNRVFKDMHRDYHRKDGDMYYTMFDNKPENTEFVSTQFHYENKVQSEGASSLFGYRKMEKEEALKLGLFDYPPIQYNYVLPTFIVEGTKNADLLVAERQLDIFAAKYGLPKKIRPWVIVFNHGDISRCREQEVYWKGGNKNEFVVCLVMNSGKVSATHVFSWTEVDSLKIDARDWFISHPDSPIKEYISWLTGELSGRFIKKSFKDFNYVSVSPPFSHVVWCWVLTSILNIALMTWNIKNEYGEGRSVRFPRYPSPIRWNRPR